MRMFFATALFVFTIPFTLAWAQVSETPNMTLDEKRAYFQSLSKEEKQEYWNNLSPEEKAALKAKIQAHRDSVPPEVKEKRKEKAKEISNNLSDEQKAQIRENFKAKRAAGSRWNN